MSKMSNNKETNTGYVVLRLIYDVPLNPTRSMRYERPLSIRMDRFKTFTDLVSRRVKDMCANQNIYDGVPREANLNDILNIHRLALCSKAGKALSPEEVIDIVGTLIVRHTCIGIDGPLHNISLNSWYKLIDKMQSSQIANNFRFNVDYIIAEVAVKYLKAFREKLISEEIYIQARPEDYKQLVTVARDYGYTKYTSVCPELIDTLIYMVTVEPYRVRRLYTPVREMYGLKHGDTTFRNVLGEMPYPGKYNVLVSNSESPTHEVSTEGIQENDVPSVPETPQMTECTA